MESLGQDRDVARNSYILTHFYELTPFIEIKDCVDK